MLAVMQMLNRRELLQLSGSAVLLAACGDGDIAVRRGADAGERAKPLTQKNPALLPADTAFPIGVMAGDATSDACVLWTRYDGSARVNLRVWEDAGQNLVTIVYDAPVAFRSAFALVDVTGLQPDRTYRYAFVANDKSRSAVGNFRTAFAEDSYAPLVFAGTSCTSQSRFPFPVLSQAALRNDIRFFIHNGDHVYCDGAVTLENYRRRYEETYEQIGMQAVHQAFSWYGTWDDHEVDDNWDPETIDPAHIEAAMQSYFEHTPVRTPTLWRSFRWGRTAEVFMLGCRSERRPSTRKSADAQYVSREQLDWLKQGLVTSKAQFKLVVNSVPIADFGGLWDFAVGDRWKGYDAQREDLLSFIAGERARGVYFLSGDFHCGFMGRVEKSGPYAGIHEIVWGPGGNKANPLYVTLDAPQWDAATPQCNFAVLNADPASDTLSVDLINEAGEAVASQQYRNG